MKLMDQIGFRSGPVIDLERHETWASYDSGKRPYALLRISKRAFSSQQRVHFNAKYNSMASYKIFSTTIISSFVVSLELNEIEQINEI